MIPIELKYLIDPNFCNPERSLRQKSRVLNWLWEQLHLKDDQWDVYSTIPENMMFWRASLSNGNVFVQSAGGQPWQTSIWRPAHPLASDLIIYSTFLPLFTEKNLIPEFSGYCIWASFHLLCTIIITLYAVLIFKWSIYSWFKSDVRSRKLYIDFDALLLFKCFGVENFHE